MLAEVGMREPEEAGYHPVKTNEFPGRGDKTCHTRATCNGRARPIFCMCGPDRRGDTWREQEQFRGTRRGDPGIWRSVRKNVSFTLRGGLGEESFQAKFSKSFIQQLKTCSSQITSFLVLFFQYLKGPCGMDS